MQSITNLVPITGNTYPVKEQLKSLGARWNGDAKAWMIDGAKADQARAIVTAAGPAKPFSSQSSYRPSRCRQCGCAGTRYNKIYRNGVCKNCYVSDKEEADIGY